MNQFYIDVLFILTQFAIIAVGGYMAHKMNHKNPIWVRMIVLAPTITCLLALSSMAHGQYVPYIEDIIGDLSVLMIYALVASRFTNNPWLDIRVKELR